MFPRSTLAQSARVMRSLHLGNAARMANYECFLSSDDNRVGHPLGQITASTMLLEPLATAQAPVSLPRCHS